MTDPKKPETLDDDDLDAAQGGIAGSVEPNDGVKQDIFALNSKKIVLQFDEADAVRKKT